MSDSVLITPEELSQLQATAKVVVIDNLFRKGSSANLNWLRSQGNIEFLKVDITRFPSLLQAMKKHKDVDLVLHLAAQVAVTTSVLDPRSDFEMNAFGTFNVLESLRHFNLKPVVVYSSTNKVYGGLELPLKEKALRYQYREQVHGLDEETLLDFHSPYGCSKGAADQYVRDYHRIYGIPTVVFRQSCIYGTRQFGVEDQGWIAHFIISLILGRPITIYGDGKQVRDALYVQDLVELYHAAYHHKNKVQGDVYNIGGGHQFTLSLLEFLKILEDKMSIKIRHKWGPWRPGDQKVYISDIRKIKKHIGWQPKVSPEAGIEKLIDWVVQEKNTLVKTLTKN